MWRKCLGLIIVTAFLVGTAKAAEASVITLT